MFGGDKEYQQLFEIRGDLYHKASLEYPLARREEFEQLIGYAGIRSEDVIADIPAGGGYMKHFLKKIKSYIPVESTEIFANLCKQFTGDVAVKCDLEDIALESGSIDKILSLSGLHHTIDKQPVFREFNRILKPGGAAVIADVFEGSAVARFLDDFIGEHNSTGHEGFYLNSGTLTSIEQAGFEIKRHDRIPYHWKFDTPDDLAIFCTNLFGVSGLDAEKFIRKSDDYLGVRNGKRGCRLNWELYFIYAEKKA